ncbi:MAG: patatin-like phospholipase family protein [Defluviitaleaceae bacterium]|nr:patatin-like phospholipase family protein [Defluviitaleaceae bacterium]
MPLCDAVFQGGGVKGTGFAGAIMVLEDAGYQFENIVGTSVGAIVAALLSVGYTGAEIRDELMRVDYKMFLDASWPVRKSSMAKMLNVALRWGMYRTDAFEHWLCGLLEKKGKTHFRHIHTNLQDERYRYKFQAIASDITERKMLLLPGDLATFGINPDDFPISTAVRMSMSLPFYFEPYRLQTNNKEHIILDGGLLSNYPVWVLDDGTSNPTIPTFGFRFVGGNMSTRKRIYENNLIGFIKAIIATLIAAWDNRHISESSGDFARTILIPTAITTQGKQRHISTTDFDITKDEKKQLLENGIATAQKFLANWNFETWKKTYRNST